MISKLSQYRDEFIDAVVPDHAGQEQINDMSKAFDAGAVSLYNVIRESAYDGFDNFMTAIQSELVGLAVLHGADK